MSQSSDNTASGNPSGRSYVPTNDSAPSSPRSSRTRSTTPNAPNTPTSSITALLKEWKEPIAPQPKCPKWIEELAEALARLRKDESGSLKWQQPSAAEMADMIRKAFAEHKVARPTQICYMSFLKTLLIQNGVLLNKLYPFHCQAVAPELYAVMYRQFSNYARWRLSQAATQSGLILAQPFLRTDLVVDGNLIDSAIKEEVRNQAITRLMDRKGLTLKNPAEFKKKVLEGLRHPEDPVRLYPALLFACGRRPASLLVPMQDVWDTEGLDLKENKIIYKEHIKKRGRPVTATIPLLCSTGLFLRALSAFQDKYLPLATAYRMRSWVKLNQYTFRYKPCDFRAIYAAYIGYSAILDDTATYPAAIARAMMHEHPSTSVHYMRVNLKE